MATSVELFVYPATDRRLYSAPCRLTPSPPLWLTSSRLQHIWDPAGDGVFCGRTRKRAGLSLVLGGFALVTRGMGCEVQVRASCHLVRSPFRVFPHLHLRLSSGSLWPVLSPPRVPLILALPPSTHSLEASRIRAILPASSCCRLAGPPPLRRRARTHAARGTYAPGESLVAYFVPRVRANPFHAFSLAAAGPMSRSGLSGRQVSDRGWHLLDLRAACRPNVSLRSPPPDKIICCCGETRRIRQSSRRRRQGPG